jgi:hypothetical protein
VPRAQRTIRGEQIAWTVNDIESPQLEQILRQIIMAQGLEKANRSTATFVTRCLVIPTVAERFCCA